VQPEKPHELLQNENKIFLGLSGTSMSRGVCQNLFGKTLAPEGDS
jgi:hypothetical protein